MTAVTLNVDFPDLDPLGRGCARHRYSWRILVYIHRVIFGAFFHSTMSGSSDRPHNADLPSISITTDLATPSQSPTHARSPSSGLLSPSRLGARGPLSPTHSDMSDAGSVPPSPTLSSHTAHFPTTLQLRDNKPDAQSGLASLNLLDAGGITSERKSSSATITSDLDGETFRLAFLCLPH